MKSKIPEIIQVIPAENGPTLRTAVERLLNEREQKGAEKHIECERRHGALPAPVARR